MRQLFLWATLGVALVIGDGCHGVQDHKAAIASPTPGQDIRVNCLSLLHDLLDQERNLGKLLLVKLETSEVRELVEAIAAASAAATKRIESLAAEDGAVDLTQLALPAGEVATRRAISRTATKELVIPFNPAFVQELLLTQAQALSYARHLAKVAAENEPNAEQARYLSRLSEQMKELRQRTIQLLRVRKSTEPAPDHHPQSPS